MAAVQWPTGSAAAIDDPAESSSFFAKLPFEIRCLVYAELWRASGLRQHMNRGPPPAAWSHSPCVTDPETEDVRYAAFMKLRSDAGSDAPELRRWEARLKSDANLHWECAALASHGHSQPSAFLPVLLACRRLYLECAPSLYESVTFCFTDMLLARDFLRSQPSDRIQSLEICIRAKPIILELYLNPPHGNASIAGAPVTADDNPWENFCRMLATLRGLRSLRIWFDSEDLRPWHRRVVETRVFARLFQVKATSSFFLDLPELPADPALHGLPGSYLEDGNLAGAPFAVRRGPRPNNWSVHLSRVSALALTMQH